MPLPDNHVGAALKAAQAQREHAPLHLTIEQARILQDSLELEAATMLGRILFAFGEFERDISLCAVWSRSGADFDALKHKIASANFDTKISVIRGSVHSIFRAGTLERIAYDEWIERVDGVRLIRNKLAHGRWWFDPYGNQVVHILGIPGSPDQTETRHTISGMTAFLKLIRALQAELNQLQSKHNLSKAWELAHFK